MHENRYNEVIFLETPNRGERDIRTRTRETRYLATSVLRHNTQYKSALEKNARHGM